MDRYQTAVERLERIFRVSSLMMVGDNPALTGRVLREILITTEHRITVLEERDHTEMARTKIAGNVRERLVNRLALLIMSSQMGTEDSRTKIETTIWTLNSVGFESDLTDQMLREAVATVGLPDTAVAAYLANGSAAIQTDRSSTSVPAGTVEQKGPAETVGSGPETKSGAASTKRAAGSS